MSKAQTRGAGVLLALLLAYCLIGALVLLNESAVQSLAAAGCLAGAVIGKAAVR